MNNALGRILIALAVSATASFAALIGPVYPAPGNNSFSSAGSVGDAGRTGFYTGFNPSDYSQLYFGYAEVDNVYNPAFTGPTGEMTFTGYNAATGIATWNSTANLFYYTNSNTPVSVATEFEMQVQPYTGINQGLLGSGWLPLVPDASVGIPASGVAYDVTGTAFQVWSRFIVVSSGLGVDTQFDANNNGVGFIETDTNGAFYYASPIPPSPEPATFGMIGLALAAFAAMKYRPQRA